ncbi:uncharacterized protein LOC135372130 [Ornithodoros turicata]|uniref:uncharacterized protein LOC135372130 n=1 Tax=Ornithodoros turicata TaxID=34597 RepID=UPI003138E941
MLYEGFCLLSSVVLLEKHQYLTRWCHGGCRLCSASPDQSTQLSNSHTVQAVNQQSGASDGSQATQSDSLEGQELWTGPKIRFLIAKYKEQKEMVGKKGGFRTKRALWQALADAIPKEFGSSVTTIQVENKWKSLERAYKRTKTKNGSSGHSRVSCEHEEELGDVHEKEHHISPTTLLAPGLKKDSSSTPTDTEGCSSPRTRHRRLPNRALRRVVKPTLCRVVRSDGRKSGPLSKPFFTHWRNPEKNVLKDSRKTCLYYSALWWHLKNVIKHTLAALQHYT